jgi:transposase-like protein
MRLLTFLNSRGFLVETLSQAVQPPRNRLARRIAAAGGEGDAYTVDELCARHRISRGLLYALWREGKGPAFMKLGHRRLVSAESAARWRQQIEAETAALSAAE